MSYVQALEAAGAKVIAYKKFGSYQGDWIAKVEFNGKMGWIRDYYGSCSGCDAFEGEFWNSSPPNRDYDGFYNQYWEQITEKEYTELKNQYDKMLSDFGMKYLDNMLTFEEVIKVASENLEWDMEAAEMVNFINENE